MNEFVFTAEVACPKI